MLAVGFEVYRFSLIENEEVGITGRELSDTKSCNNLGGGNDFNLRESWLCRNDREETSQRDPIVSMGPAHHHVLASRHVGRKQQAGIVGVHSCHHSTG